MLHARSLTSSQFSSDHSQLSMTLQSRRNVLSPTSCCNENHLGPELVAGCSNEESSNRTALRPGTVRCERPTPSELRVRQQCHCLAAKCTGRLPVRVHIESL